MNTEKIKTLEQVQDALDIIENAWADQNLNAHEKLELEKAAVKLRNLERSIIKKVEQDLIDCLTTDSKALKDLSNQIKQSSDKLAGIAAAIEKAANVVEAFISIVKAATAAGLI